MNDFDEYIRQGEPDKKEKSIIWQTAIGLQQVDGLKPSAFLIETARENIEGKITIEEVQYRIDSYYKTKTAGTDFQSAKSVQNEVPKSNICTLEERFVLEFLNENPKATQKEIAAHIQKSERTVKTITANLQSKNLLQRINGKRNGFWKILK
ncbi:MAG: antitoxin VbhA family protein [Tannerella sp.]|jgi:predicted HTH transcriptional regulator|nr:antitoxin VbhA family protein [Tannerella sp.]